MLDAEQFLANLDSTQFAEDESFSDYFERIIRDESSELSRAYRRALRYVLRDPARPSKRVKMILLQNGYSKEVIEDVICYLKERNLLDEAEYCQRLFWRHTGYKQKSRGRIYQLCLQNGVTPKVAKAMCGRLPADEITLAEYVELQASKLLSMPEPKRVRHLMSRGYSYRLIKTALEQLQ